MTSSSLTLDHSRHAPTQRGLKLGFLGTGWIGQHRMASIFETGLVETAVVYDAIGSNAQKAASLAANATCATTVEELMNPELDGIVIATPNAGHARQCLEALDRGLSVFCQKPLGRNAAEVQSVIEAAAAGDRLLGVDLSYRGSLAMQKACACVRSGGIGDVYAASFVFHNAYGPDKPWFYNRDMSGGGCLLDLGVHLVDAALWMLDFPEIVSVSSRLYQNGRPYQPGLEGVEDFAFAELVTAAGTCIRLSCSWNLHAGRDAIIAADLHGSTGGVSVSNCHGSFYDFSCHRHQGTNSEVLTGPPDDWGGRMAARWAQQLAADPRFDASAWPLLDVTRVLDAIYAASSKNNTQVSQFTR